MNPTTDRKPAWSGVFYPADPRDLERDVNRYMEESGEHPSEEEVIGLVAPHAGYVYSGPVAGHAYASIKGRSYSRVVVLSPSHRVAFQGVAIWPRGTFETPLGSIPIDEDGCDRLLDRAGGFFTELPAAHTKEHGIEVHLPFLQEALSSFKLIPLILGGHDLETARNLGRILAETFPERDTLFVASSDLSHYYEYDHAVQIDSLLLDTLEKQDTEGLARALGRGETEACGAGPILTVATISRDFADGHATLLRYANSGDTAGTRDEVVGYASFLFSTISSDNDRE